MFRLQFFQPGFQIGTDFRALGRPVLVDHDLGAGRAGRGRQGVAAEGGAVVAGLQHGILLLAQESAQRRAGAEALGHGQGVRLEAELLVAEQGAEPPHACLHLVRDEHQVLFVTPGADLREVIRVRHVHAALSLHRLQQHRAGLIRGGLLDGVHVVIRHVDEPRHQRPPVVLVVRLSGSRHHGHGAPVKRVVRRDDLVGAVQVQLAVLAGELAHPLVGLRPGVAEEHPVHAGIVDQDLGQLELRNGVEQVAHLQDHARLLLDGRRDLGV